MTTVSTKPKTPTKTAIVCKLLARSKGASVAEIMGATGWQNHSVRAFFTGLRKKGEVLAREERTTGETAYRLVADVKPAAAQ